MPPNFQYPVKDVHTIAKQGEWKVCKMFKVGRNVTKKQSQLLAGFKLKTILRDRVRPVPTVFFCLRRWRNDGLTAILPNGLPI